MGRIPGIFDMDYPDPDVIRVEQDYYMVTTTMHFIPGCEILHSKDLKHWEHMAFVYDSLDHTQAQVLEKEEQIYGKGMWAASIRYQKGIFYICFAANDTQKTYLYTSKDIKGPWKKSIIEGFYHDASLYFEEKSVFIIYGNKVIYLTELNQDLSKPKEGGLHRKLISDADNEILGYEGSHFYKIKDYYYLFVIHSSKNEWKRVEACFRAESLTGDFIGKDVYNEDNGFYNQGIAQGGIVDTSDGKWYAMLFQDRGAVGRLPVLVPVLWENDFPVFQKPCDIRLQKEENNAERLSEKVLVGDDDFRWNLNLQGVCKPNHFWQWNHEPDAKNWFVDRSEGGLTITTDKISKNLLQAQNTLTQRMSYPKCEAYVTIAASKIENGDYAGIAAFAGSYGMIAITKENGKSYISMQTYETDKMNVGDLKYYSKEALEHERIRIFETTVQLKLEVDFSNQMDTSKFSYWENNRWNRIGITHKLYFQLDHFCGCRFALFHYATKTIGGAATFHEFCRNDE